MTADGTKVTIETLQGGVQIGTGAKHTFVVLGPTIRLVSVEAPTFVPGEETTAISYAIDGPVSEVALVSLKVWSAPPKGDRVAVAIVDIAGPYSANGKYDWDGTIDKSGKPITIKGSPYEVEFVLQTKVGTMSTSNKETIKLAIEKIQIHVDNPPLLVGVGPSFEPAIDGLVSELKNSGMPNDCEGRLWIDSPVFKRTDWEMDYDASFRAYQAAVGSGPPVPFLAEITLKSKAGGGKRAPRALVGTRVLWDFKLDSSGDLDGALAARGVRPPAKAFVKKVASYEEATTQPKGVSAHLKAGGWRTTSANRQAAGRQWGSAGSSWKLTWPTDRNWSAFTGCGPDAFTDVDSAVFFLPGRMAGDTHRVSAVVDLDEALDVADEAAPNGAPAAHRSNKVKITIWRRLQIVGNWIVGAGAVPVDIPSLTQEYKQAGLLIEPAPGLAMQDVGARWKAAYQAACTSLAAWSPFFRDALEPNPGQYAVRFREFMDYWQRTHPQAGFFGKLGERIGSFFSSQDEDKYKNDCSEWWYSVLERAATHLNLPERGLTIMKFDAPEAYNQVPKNKGVGGIAPAISGLTTRTKAIFFQFTLSKSTDTFVHEVGHLLFLAHAPGHSRHSEEPEGAQADAHDKDEVCVMSYKDNAKHLCGLCLLKLAGWNVTRIDRNGNFAA